MTVRASVPLVPGGAGDGGRWAAFCWTRGSRLMRAGATERRGGPWAGLSRVAAAAASGFRVLGTSGAGLRRLLLLLVRRVGRAVRCSAGVDPLGALCRCVSPVGVGLGGWGSTCDFVCMCACRAVLWRVRAVPGGVPCQGCKWRRVNARWVGWMSGDVRRRGEVGSGLYGCVGDVRGIAGSVGSRCGWPALGLWPLFSHGGGRWRWRAAGKRAGAGARSVYGHPTLATPDLVRSRKLSRVGPG